MMLAALSPLIVGIAILTWALSGKSPLIAHLRVGQHASELWVFKIRTMWLRRERRPLLAELFSIERIDDEVGPGLKGPADVRTVSRFARFCRKHSLDELPQLINVLLGQMSLVGPRPVTRAELDTIYGSEAAKLLEVKPGLTGLWQVSGRNRLTPGERRQLDLECAGKSSLGFYCWTLIRTFLEVIRGDTW